MAVRVYRMYKIVRLKLYIHEYYNITIHSNIFQYRLNSFRHLNRLAVEVESGMKILRS